MSNQEITQERIQNLWKQLKQQAEAGGYHLNPDDEFTKDLVRSLIVNQQRYGYRACPCRLAAGEKASDLDIICPCDYRDADISEYGACYCGLYVSEDVVTGEKSIRMIPERRPAPEERAARTLSAKNVHKPLAMPVWRCRVCGYLCARDGPPEVCPICKAKKERFERFM
ncbi:MAG: ferredoxin:glutaredoxin reductase [candidate division WOR-3 bacterium]|nr:MAG: ferredoxin:glutaredoxin reductase [candidate division WOR-3 bacterium]